MNLIYLSNTQNTKSSDHIIFVPYFYDYYRNLCNKLQVYGFFRKSLYFVIINIVLELC